MHLCYAFVGQFTDSVNREVYLAMRRLFLERMGLEDSFDFYRYLQDCLEEVGYSNQGPLPQAIVE